MHKKFIPALLLGVLMILFGLWLIHRPIHQYYTAPRTIDLHKLIRITRPLLEDPMYHSVRVNKGVRIPQLEINFVDQYPDFVLEGPLLDATDYKAVIRDIKAGDTITVLVDKDSYIYGINFRNNEYVDRSKYGYYLKKNFKSKLIDQGLGALMFCFMAGFFFWYIVKESHRLRRKTSGKTSFFFK